MPDLPIKNQSNKLKLITKGPPLSLKERRKWDGIVIFLLFFFAFVASVLFNVLVQSQPMIANTAIGK